MNLDQTWQDFLRELEQVRAVVPQVGVSMRATDDDGDGFLGVMSGHFSVFNRWYEIDSFFEGRFLERTAPGAFKKTIAENRDNMRVLFDHGFDPSVGNKVLGPIRDLREDSTGPYYEVPLFDTSYNRDLEPGLRSDPSVYGSSFRFRVIKDEWNDEPGRSATNPEGIPERTIKEMRVMEFGPVTFPANPEATAGVRSMTDEFYDRLRSRNPDQYDQLLARARETRTPDREAASGTSRDGAASPAEEPHKHSEVQRRMQQRRRERLQARGLLDDHTGEAA